jgi:hypothetical protein
MNETMMAKCLALMAGAGLKLYGRELNLTAANAYLSVCRSHGVTDAELIQKAAGAFAADGGDFPDAARFARRCVTIREAGMVAIGVPSDDGETLRIEWVPVDEQMSEPRRVPSLEMARPTPELPKTKKIPAVSYGDERDVDAWKAEQIRRLKGDD